MFCEKCGSSVKDGAEFCLSCGRKLDIRNEDSNTDLKENSYTNNNNILNSFTEENRDRTKTTNLIIPILALAFSILSISSLFIFLFSNLFIVGRYTFVIYSILGFLFALGGLIFKKEYNRTGRLLCFIAISIVFVSFVIILFC